ncbi:leucine-rich repeat-containing protein 42 [Rhinophrynus dorsalis]
MSQCLEPQKSEDTGPIYVREKGQLSLIGSHSSQIRAQPSRVFSRGFSVKLCVKQEDASRHRQKPFIFTYTEEGSLRYSAKTLFILALDLISDNIQHVDSLVGFPEQIAEKLFTAAEAKHKFYTHCSGLMALRKFTEAYGDLVLSSLCLRGKYLLVSERLEEIKSFCGLRCLDLSCCKLGDEHELLGHLTTDPMASLTELYLKDNCLSDTGIRRMTASVRVLQRGLGSLTVLDLSDNPGITDKGVAFLFAFKQLNFLNISGTGVQVPSAIVKRIQTRVGLLPTEKPLAQFDHVNCGTRGWAEQLFGHWESLITLAIKPKETCNSRKAAQQFYGKEKKSNPLDSVKSVFQNPLTQKHLQFFRPKGQTDPVSSNCDTGQSSVKRPCTDCTREDDTVPSTKRPRVTITAADWDLLNAY